MLVGLGATAATVVGVATSIGGTNPDTPPGFEGYIVHKPLLFGRRTFVGTQTGPTSTGWVWRQYVTNIDMRTTTASEQMHIFSKDNLEVSFEAHARIRLRPGTVRKIVEEYSGEGWYANNVQRPYRTAVRETVRQYEAFDIKDRSVDIATAVLERLRREYAETPFEFLDMSIGNIDYPDSVEERVVANLASEQRRQRMEVQERIAESQAQIREMRAGGEAEAQRIEQETLTSLYVRHEAAELLTRFADETDDEDGIARAEIVVVIPTRVDQAGVARIEVSR